MTDTSTPVRHWKNCYADVLTYAYDRTAQAFLDEVIRPAFAALDARLQALREDEDPSVVFVIADHEVLTEQTALALALAIQSMWERQLRAYVSGCAGELKIAQAIKQSSSNVWKDVEEAFELTRGIPLRECRDTQTSRCSTFWGMYADTARENHSQPFGASTRNFGQAGSREKRPLARCRPAWNLTRARPCMG
jgi:hypothetical protein